MASESVIIKMKNIKCHDNLADQQDAKGGKDERTENDGQNVLDKRAEEDYRDNSQRYFLREHLKEYSLINNKGRDDL